MCLITDHFFPKISFRKIKVYKIAIFKDGGFITPFQHVNLLEKTKERFIFPKNKVSKERYIIEEGMIHAFKTKKCAITAKYDIYYMSPFSKDSIRIIPAYIPPFTRYYIGENGDICAKRMKYENLDI